MFIGVYKKSVILTYLGLVFAILGMYFAFIDVVKEQIWKKNLGYKLIL